MKQNVRLIAASYYLVLYVLWAILECVIVPKLELQTNHVYIDIIKEIICKTLFWFIPALLLILRYSDQMFFKKSELLGNSKKAVDYIPMCIFIILFTAWFLIPNYYQNGTIVINRSFNAEAALSAIFAGITEEMVFRGLLLNSALKDRRTWVVFSGNAVMFLLIHFPIWIREGIFVTYMTNIVFLQLIALSLIFSWTFVKSRNILTAIILHAYWDLLCCML